MEITPKNKFKFRRNTKLLVGNLSKIKLNNVFMTVFFFSVYAVKNQYYRKAAIVSLLTRRGLQTRLT